MTPASSTRAFGRTTGGTLARAFAAGLSTGSRTFTASAFLAQSGPTQNRTKAITGAFAVTELVADKHPSALNRTEPPGLISRSVASVTNGAVIARRRGEAAVPAAIVSLMGATAGCFGGLWWRERCGDFGVPELAAAFLEDGAALGLAVAAARN